MAKTENDKSKGQSNFFISKNKSKAHRQLTSSSGNFFVTPSEKTDVTKRHQPTENATKSKKPFDKKKWRIKKYSKKYKLEQWENQRKKRVLEGYYREMKEEEPKFDVQKIYEKYGDEEGENDNNLNKDLLVPSSSGTGSPRGKKSIAFKKAKSEFQRIQDEKKRKQEEIIKNKLERAEALKQYKAKKLEKYKKLNKKTKKGQPVMKYRMEMLLEQIQKSMS
ncbi:hypothetical protein PPYR_02544 [Photinus pyralis]|uniref:rRNA-processing protein FYV7 n=1 Tax=Photinus pyralis TaxID=7054 RepID=A0A1Y1MRU9_PHOPY|nr:thyroid transcription factor 1-associated protein 26 homolog [Photinus pyralis]KAB0805574.1 hypothetical protein PPYR_02544 [Photinus pyralis]